MAAVPATINLVENNLAPENDKSNYSAIYGDANSHSDKEQLVDVHLEGGNNQQSVKHEERDICQLYNKIWPLRVLKVADWILLLASAVCASLCASYSLWWSNYWKSLLKDRLYNLSSEFAVGQWILFVLVSLSFVAHFVAKSKFSAALFSLMDLCFYALAVPVLVVTNLLFSLITVAEYRWFGPKLVNFNHTVEEYADLTSTNLGYLYKSSDDWRWSQMEERERQILLHLVADPLIVFLTTVAIPLNIAVIACLCKAMRRGGIWASSVDYKESFPECTKIERQYARHYPFGMLKTVQWLLPVLLLLACLYIPMFNMAPIRSESAKYFLLVPLLCFAHWLFYYCAVHLRPEIGHWQEVRPTDGSNKITKCCQRPIRLSTLFFVDIFISGCASVLLLIICFSSRYLGILMPFFLFGTVLYGGYFLLLCSLFRREGNSQIFSLPFSIKFTLEITKREKTAAAAVPEQTPPISTPPEQNQ